MAGSRGGVTWRGHVAASVRWGHTRRRPRLTPCVRQPLTACVRPGLMLSATASLPCHWQRSAVTSWPKCSHQAQDIRSSINGFDADSSQMFKAHVTIAVPMAGSCRPASNQRNRWLRPTPTHHPPPVAVPLISTIAGYLPEPTLIQYSSIFFPSSRPCN